MAAYATALPPSRCRCQVWFDECATFTKAFQHAKDDESLPRPGPPGVDANVRKPEEIPVAFPQSIIQTYGVRI